MFISPIELLEMEEKVLELMRREENKDKPIELGLITLIIANGDDPVDFKVNYSMYSAKAEIVMEFLEEKGLVKKDFLGGGRRKRWIYIENNE